MNVNGARAVLAIALFSALITVGGGLPAHASPDGGQEAVVRVSSRVMNDFASLAVGSTVAHGGNNACRKFL